MKYFSDVYKKEIKMCRELYQKRQGCGWGKCDECGVIPLLHKFETGEVVENCEEIIKLKNKILIN